MSEQRKTKISVNIYGQSYQIVGSESSSHMRQVAEIVDEKMREIRSNNVDFDVTKVAVLTAVNTVHDYLKAHERIEQLEQELKKLKG